MNYCSLDELDIRVEGSNPPTLEKNHKVLAENIRAYEARLAEEEVNYRLYHHEFFPGRKRRRRY